MNETILTQFNIYCKYNFKEIETDMEKTVKLMTCLVLGGFGIFGNVFVILLAVKYTVTKRLHFLIINMAVTDTLSVFFHSLSYMIYGYLTTNIWDGLEESIAKMLCKTLSFLYYVVLIESLVTLLFISTERY